LQRICAGHRLIYLLIVVSFSGRIISGRFRAHRGSTKTATGFSCHLLGYTGWEWKTKRDIERVCIRSETECDEVKDGGATREKKRKPATLTFEPSSYICSRRCTELNIIIIRHVKKRNNMRHKCIFFIQTLFGF